MREIYVATRYARNLCRDLSSSWNIHCFTSSMELLPNQFLGDNCRRFGKKQLILFEYDQQWHIYQQVFLSFFGSATCCRRISQSIVPALSQLFNCNFRMGRAIHDQISPKRKWCDDVKISGVINLLNDLSKCINFFSLLLSTMTPVTPFKNESKRGFLCLGHGHGVIVFNVSIFIFFGDVNIILVTVPICSFNN